MDGNDQRHGTYLFVLLLLSKLLLLLLRREMDSLLSWLVFLRILEGKLFSMLRAHRSMKERHTPLKSLGSMWPFSTACLIFACASGWSL